MEPTKDTVTFLLPWGGGSGANKTKPRTVVVGC